MTIGHDVNDSKRVVEVTKVFLLVFPQQSVKDEAIFEVSLQYF